MAALSADLRREIEIAQMRAAERRQTTRERLKHGFCWPGDIINGRYVPAFVSRRLRSALHPLLRLFVAGTLRAETGLGAGDAKDRLLCHGSKLALLDCPYVGFNQTMRSIIRIDLDRTFLSWEALRVAIEAVGLPAPNLAVGRVDAEGRVEHPHAYWLLANAVCCTAQGRPGPQRLLRGLERALVAALVPIGADPGGLANPHTGKNPLSELWDCQILTAVPFNLTNGAGAQPGLPALADNIRPRFTSLKPAAPTDESDVAGALQQSNGAFYVLRAYSGRHVERCHPRGRGEGTRDEFIAAVIAYARGLAPYSRLSAGQLEKTARTTAEYAWDHFDPLRRRGSRPQRGRCQVQCTGKDQHERQQIGARDVAARRRAATIARLLTAYDSLVQDGRVLAGRLPPNRLLAVQAGLAVRTLQKCRAEFQAALRTRDERRCIDKGISPMATPSAVRNQPPAMTPHSALSNSEIENFSIYMLSSGIRTECNSERSGLINSGAQISSRSLPVGDSSFVPSRPSLAPAPLPPPICSPVRAVDPALATIPPVDARPGPAAGPQAAFPHLNLPDLNPFLPWTPAGTAVSHPAPTPACSGRAPEISTAAQGDRPNPFLLPSQRLPASLAPAHCPATPSNPASAPAAIAAGTVTPADLATSGPGQTRVPAAGARLASRPPPASGQDAAGRGHFVPPRSEGPTDMPSPLRSDAPTPAAPAVSATPACPHCGGSGWRRIAAGTVKRCICQLRQDAIAYLTPLYADTQLAWDRTLAIAPLAGRNVVITKAAGERGSAFQRRSLAAVKSYLLNTWRDSGTPCSHQTLTPYEILQRSWNDLIEYKLLSIEQVDLLVLRFGFDPPKKHYGEHLRSLLMRRQSAHRPTWVLTEWPFTDGRFVERYDDRLADYLGDTFNSYRWETA